MFLTMFDIHSLTQCLRFEFQIKSYDDALDIRLLAPRQGINCFLVLITKSLELFCEYRLKLYHLKTLEINGNAVFISHHLEEHFVFGRSREPLLLVTHNFGSVLAQL